ncbi:hypothetical protein [Accumulibacter sp.]|uniref:hypothetical protein n=1 Tax=Accumulibacter sp. TaxID=2053492 RepID=UPI002600FDEF|nr:hypothetical protein [Accumulibacter sp.]MCM8613730.1 hypothetical protein [Accumulibacter sp.]MCM8637374.1 hypothetical protein [Accumulibacter sp.]MCM8640910.1 hypothetical protein [Accumulibacter sp.]
MFSTMEQQAQTLVRLAKAADAVVQGRESAHSVRLFDLDQCRENLWRRSCAVIDSLADHGRSGELEDLRCTSERLDRAAAGLFRTATACRCVHAASGALIGQMLRRIRCEGEGLRDACAGLASGEPSVPPSAAGDACGSLNPLGSYRSLALLELLPGTGLVWRQAPDELAAMPGPHAASSESWATQMHAALHEVVRELAGAGEILRRLAQRLADGLALQQHGAGDSCLVAQQGYAAT